MTEPSKEARRAIEEAGAQAAAAFDEWNRANPVASLLERTSAQFMLRDKFSALALDAFAQQAALNNGGLSVMTTYSYSKSQMKPSFWIIEDGERVMAEVWNEEDARRIVAALTASSGTTETF